MAKTKFFIVLMAMGMLAACNSKMIITENGIDIFFIGEQIPFNAANYTIEKEMMTFEEAIEEPVYIVSENGQKMFSISPEYDVDSESFTEKISDITVFSSKFKTTEGIGVHSSIKDFIDKYPDFTVWYTYVSDSYVIETKQYQKLQFILDKDDFTGKEIAVEGDMAILKLSDFKEHSKIKEIRIF